MAGAPVLPVLGSWDTRGVAESIRYLLKFLKIEFKDERYAFGQAPNYWKIWREKRDALGLEIPKLPYFIQGDVKLIQATPIMRYLARKSDQLYFPDGKNLEEVVRLEVVEDHARDFHRIVEFISFHPEYELKIQQLTSRYVEYLESTIAFMKNSTWVLGDKISHVDFIMVEALDKSRYYFKDAYNSFDEINKYVERFFALDGIKEYRCIAKKWPLFSPDALFAGSGDEPAL